MAFLGVLMKIIPEQTTTSLIHTSDQGLKLDVGAFCFFTWYVFSSTYISSNWLILIFDHIAIMKKPSINEGFYFM